MKRIKLISLLRRKQIPDEWFEPQHGFFDSWSLWRRKFSLKFLVYKFWFDAWTNTRTWCTRTFAFFHGLKGNLLTCGKGSSSESNRLYSANSSMNTSVQIIGVTRRRKRVTRFWVLCYILVKCTQIMSQIYLEESLRKNHKSLTKLVFLQ